MGYIAPIPHHQYKQYAEREMKIVYDPFKFVPIPRINLKSKLKEKDHTRLQQKFSRRKKKHPTLINKKIMHDSSISPDFLAEFTGKGIHFNEYV
ncbi:hypothetical protein JOC86_003110 [Bacillus pakistanensis]|uniref:Uncharacterized protein n=1 Tax=Rossellomorea pakistanensis TaxID=992288 RepID=A0ABS2NFC0_9BACI|nr:hypothetical protein [Bacillus pakistanensis]MBM7586558.1 hypothetical protein [Bacillus pakistanensis]